MNQDEFTRPISLHRRDPRQPVSGKGVKEDEVMADEPIDSKEKEKQEILKAEREARRAADLAQIAPTGNNASAMAAKKSQAFRNEKTTQVHRLDKTEAQKKESDLRYEEALPWHMEDADNKNIWVGNYEAALSDTNVIFVIEGTSFKMVPIEKWYKFTQKNQFKSFTIEEAEARFSKATKESRWDKKTQEKARADKEAAESRRQLGRLFTVKTESKAAKNASKSEFQDADDLDFDDNDLFQDDDEQAFLEPDKDEEVKESKERIKREQLGANIFDQANEADVDEELAEERREAEKRKKLGKEVKKALAKREKMTVYESDSSNPYASSSEDDTSDEEKQKEIDRRKDEEAKNKLKAESKLPSGASSKGTNTPSGRPKYSNLLKKPTSLKRAGSPNLSASEASGNESSRKKHKKKHSSQATGSSTPIPGSRPMSPAPTSQPGSNSSPRKSSIIKLNLNPSKLSEIQSVPPNPSPITGGATSDGEATGGEMSDGGKRSKIKLRLGGSPTGSRAGSPGIGRAGSGGSRADSPSAQVQAASPGERAQSPGVGPIQPHEIVAALPKEGITISDLMKVFTTRVGSLPGQTDKKEFIRLVKENSLYGADKRLRQK